MLQELIQQNAGDKLHYEQVSESGPDHEKVFSSVVYLNDRIVGKGSGKSKKEAEQSAARNALAHLNV